MKIHHNVPLAIAGLAILLATSVSAELLTPADLHPLAHWGGSERDGFLQTNHVADIHDGDVGTRWTRTSGGGDSVNATPMLTSPHPFIVTQIVVVASTGTPSKSAGAIEIMKVGSAAFTNIVEVPNTLTAGQVWSTNMPPAHQVPISAIRHNGTIWDPEMQELSFYGSPV